MNHQVKTSVFLLERPVFSLEEAAKALPGGKRRVFQRLQHYVKTKRLRPVARGVYVAVPPGDQARRFQPDPFLVAAAARPDAVFAYHSALELLGAAHSEWTRFTVCTDRRRAPVVLGRLKIEFLDHPPGLKRSRQTSLGVRAIDRRGRKLEFTGPERTLVDGFRRPDRVGGLGELVESAAGFGVLDLKLLARLLEAYGEKSLWAATGWFLERYRKTFFTPDDVLAAFEARRPKAPHYADPRHRGGRFVRRWNLILPEALVGAQEPNER